MKDCCVAEARKNVRRHRDVAWCDGCGALVLGYGVEDDYRAALVELEANGTAFEHDKIGAVWVIAKARKGCSQA